MNNQPARKKWPESAPYIDAIKAFDAALTRAARDEAFRHRVTSSPASAKAAVAEIGNIDIPDDRVIVFYEPQAPKSDAAPSALGAENVAAQMEAAVPVPMAGSSSSENVHVFYLPPLNPEDTTTEYKYEEFFMCCYDQWLR
jgi:hypothetical protein